ncbi:hypothetical protein GWO43_06755 [candidate division KSB1 bacterium]|nr:hypothetical protein [candidate division KSB1 bacterium]NIR72607.1 hypothetical protein [candidate division KSB1 bacterium]NIS23661.1 hypothetical protein [candidate division KSB1 bacterium]NIT70585.1 hypothetical protein [candidate division KSB1 bacterium]NIU24303.1 hypothetical protein [candidate division KSB1 bacterium]
MDLAILLLLFAGFLIFFKIIGVVFKAGIFVLSIPFQIFGALLGVLLVILLVPFAVVAGVLTAVLAPLFILGPFLPFLLILFGLYLVFRH